MLYFEFKIGKYKKALGGLKSKYNEMRGNVVIDQELINKKRKKKEERGIWKFEEQTVREKGRRRRREKMGK